MSIMGREYGSEWHLRSLLANAPEHVNQQILATLVADGVQSARSISWHPNYRTIEAAEIRNVDFLDAQSPIRKEWHTWWPQSGNVPNWDAVGTANYETGASEWLLVEAKAHLNEVHQDCNAKEHGGRLMIRQRLAETQLAFGVTPARDWTKGHYQYANRLAVLHFLQSRNILTRLLFIYVIGDTGSKNRDCPADATPWQTKIAELKAHLGLTGSSPLEQRVHTVFLQVASHTKNPAINT